MSIGECIDPDTNKTQSEFIEIEWTHYCDNIIQSRIELTKIGAELKHPRSSVVASICIRSNGCFSELWSKSMAARSPRIIALPWQESLASWFLYEVYKSMVASLCGFMIINGFDMPKHIHGWPTSQIGIWCVAALAQHANRYGEILWHLWMCVETSCAGLNWSFNRIPFHPVGS